MRGLGFYRRCIDPYVDRTGASMQVITEEEGGDDDGHPLKVLVQPMAIPRPGWIGMVGLAMFRYVFF